MSAEILERLQFLGVESDIEKRWEDGPEHHDLSKCVRKLIYALDEHGQFQFGGDGDNGEEILYFLDVFFDLLVPKTSVPSNAMRSLEEIKDIFNNSEV